ncbi:MAG: hypothetical protein ACRCXM_03370, partial [Beijerinckiaceae bacterium]
ANEKIVMQLNFVKPFEAHNRVTFTLTPEGEGTRVAWAMDGPQPFMAKLMGVVMNMDRMVGKDFEKGLATLGAVASASRGASPAA